jgi:hypothetical protein
MVLNLWGEKEIVSVAPVGPMGPDPGGYFMICEYTICPDLLHGSHDVTQEHFLQTFFFLFGRELRHLCMQGGLSGN